MNYNDSSTRQTTSGISRRVLSIMTTCIYIVYNEGGGTRHRSAQHCVFTSGHKFAKEPRAAFRVVVGAEADSITQCVVVSHLAIHVVGVAISVAVRGAAPFARLERCEQFVYTISPSHTRIHAHSHPHWCVHT